MKVSDGLLAELLAAETRAPVTTTNLSTASATEFG